MTPSSAWAISLQNFSFRQESRYSLVPTQAWCGVLGQRFSFQPRRTLNLGSGKWSAGPGFVVFLSDRALHVTTGFLILNLWSFAGDEDRANVNAMTLQPFLNYNLPKGWYLTTSPLITANWEADDDNRWTVPIGGGIGRIFKIGHQPINANIAAYYNVVTPDDTGANWQLRAEWTFLFPDALTLGSLSGNPLPRKWEHGAQPLIHHLSGTRTHQAQELGSPSTHQS